MKNIIKITFNLLVIFFILIYFENIVKVSTPIIHDCVFCGFSYHSQPVAVSNFGISFILLSSQLATNIAIS